MQTPNSANLEKLIAIADFESYTYLEGNKAVREQEKNQFLDGSKKNPNLDYPKLDDETLKRFRSIQAELKEFIKVKTIEAETLAADLTKKDTEDQNIDKTELEKKYIETYAYVLKAEEKLAEIEMLIAAFEGNSLKFAEKSIETFGAPNPRTYRIIKRQLATKISKISEFSNERQEALNRLQISVPDLFKAETEQESSTNDDELLRIIGESIDGRAKLNEEEVTNDNFTPEEFALICSRVLQQIKADGWDVEISENAKNFSADQETKKIIIPRNANEPIEQKRAQELLVHEIGTHVLRRINGSRQKMQLLEIGLDRYLPGEEAIATIREYTVTNKKDLIGAVQQYLAISLAYGLDGNPRDFRETYEIIVDLKIVLGESNPTEKAWNLVVRAFRGTDCQTKGAVYTKDLAYLDGRLDLAETLKTNPTFVNFLDVGKFNPADFRHLLVLYSQGIIDENLKIIS